MTGNEYQAFARRTQIPYDTKKDKLIHAVCGLCSEAGEVASIVQKAYQGHTFDVDHMKKELGDCLWMIAEACDCLNITFDDVMQTNIEKLQKRYPDGFDPEKSLHRAAGDL